MEIQCWLVRNGCLRLADISTWNRDGKWAVWEFPTLPGRSDSLLHSQFMLLLKNLNGMVPIHSSCKDVWGWGSTDSYSTALGYKSLQDNRIYSNSAKF